MIDTNNMLIDFRLARLFNYLFASPLHYLSAKLTQPINRQNKNEASGGILMMGLLKYHRDHSIHIERECLAVSTFAKLGCFVRQICFLLLLYYSNFRGSGS